MPIHPILAAMRRNALGPVLIAIQIALTLAILSNALFIIHERLVSMARSTGVDEARLFAIQNQWIGKPADIGARVQTDLAALRSVPGVVDVYATNSYPLSDLGDTFAITLHPGVKGSEINVGVYLADSQTLRTLGLRLIAGRNFGGDDVQSYYGSGPPVPPPDGVIVTQQLARQLAPDGNVLGRVATLVGFPTLPGASVPIVGVVKALQVATADPPPLFRPFHMSAYSSMLLPYRDAAANAYYVVRVASAAQVGPAMKVATARLYAVSRARVLRDVESLSAARQRLYRGDRGQVIMLTGVSAVLLAMTGWGIVGLTSCWVNQRRRHIGIRRALGATHAAIVRHFQTENLLIAGAGVLAGVGLAIAANFWMVDRFQMARLDYRYAVLGAIVMLLLGQVATLWPALRATSVPPAEAARTL